jgi:hypothetical protein
MKDNRSSCKDYSRKTKRAYRMTEKIRGTGTENILKRQTN